MKRLAVLALALILARCATAPPPPPPPEPVSAPAPEVAQPQQPIGKVRVTAATANIRSDASTTGTVIAQVKKGERLALMESRGEWMNVRLGTGATGWVSSKLVTYDAPPPKRARAGCVADSDYRFVNAPKPSFSDSSKHGVVTVEANVNPQGAVMSTRVISNTTGDDALAFLTEREIKGSKFAAPIRNCVAKAFIFTYKRSF